MIRFAKPLKVYDLPLSQEADDVVDVRVVGQPQDVVIGEPGLLLGGQILGQISDDVAGGLNRPGAPGEPGGGGGVDAGGVIYKIGSKGGIFLNILIGEVPGQLVDDGRHHFHMAQFFCTYKGVEMYQFKIKEMQ